MQVATASEFAGRIRREAADRDRFVVGITGPPGSGKSTLAARLGEELAAPVVPMDGFHLMTEMLAERRLLEVKGSPETFDAAAFVELVRRLHDPSDTVSAPAFDRVVDEPVPNRVIVRSNDVIVIVEGNYLLLDRKPWSNLRRAFDLVGYLDVPDELRVRRLVERHVAFGKGRAEAAAFVARSDERNAALIRPGRERADVVVTGAESGAKRG